MTNYVKYFLLSNKKVILRFVFSKLLCLHFEIWTVPDFFYKISFKKLVPFNSESIPKYCAIVAAISE